MRNGLRVRSLALAATAVAAVALSAGAARADFRSVACGDIGVFVSGGCDAGTVVIEKTAFVSAGVQPTGVGEVTVTMTSDTGMVSMTCSFAGPYRSCAETRSGTFEPGQVATCVGSVRNFVGGYKVDCNTGEQ